MNSTSVRAKALACALLAGTALCGLAAPASAQTSPTYRNLDSNGVDLVRGDFLTSFPEGSIGSGEAELVLLRMVGATGTNGTQGSSQWDHILFNLTTAAAYVEFGSRNDKFPGAESRGASLAGSGASYQYRSADGTVIHFTDPSPGGDSTYCDGTVQPSCVLFPTSVTSPDGKVVNINYEFFSRCVTSGGGGGGGPPYELPDPEDPPETTTVCQNTARIASVTNSFGYEIRFTYASGTTGSGSVPATFHQRTGASFHNTIASSSPLASVSYSYPSAGVTDVTDQGGLTWRVTSGSTAYAVRRPGASSDTTSASLSGGIVTSVTREGVTTNYARSVSGSTATMTVTNALGEVSTVTSSLTSGRPTSVTDPLSHTTGFTYDSDGRLKRTTAHEGNYVELTYDMRGNVIETVAVPKGGTGPTILTSSFYDSACSNPVTCNRPSSTTDARGNVTDYSYDPTHGGVLTVTEPAVGGVRPQTRYTYTLINGEHQVTEVSQCRTTASCLGTADEVKTALAYDLNGNLYWTATGDGTGALVAAATTTFDAIGNPVAVDGPLPGAADTSRTRYDPARRAIGSVSPDPDGAGPLKHRATRSTYDSTTGLLTRVEQGNVDSQSDTDWAAFAPAQAVETLYDNNARPVVGKLVSGSTVYSLGQTSYDALGRPECSAQRMNPAAFGSTLPAACTLGTQGTGANDHGPDRIAKSFYDGAGRVWQVRSALGVAGEEAIDFTATFTANGQVETVTDAEGNRTTYEYDGHDRLSKTRYPDTTKGAGTSSTTDYEQPTYESLAGGTRTSDLVVAYRNRGNQTADFAYDSLGRQVSKDLPGTEPDVSYGYDLLGHLISATQTGHTLSFTYDALGRKLSETGPFGTTSSQYDLAGRRTRLTWPDGFYADYDHLVTGEVSAIRENGATSGAGVRAVFAYDSLGRRTGLTRGNGSTTNYTYDALSRLSSLGHDLAGTTHDVTIALTYNPASQIATRTLSNDLFAWTAHGSGSTSSTVNGLNQLSVSGGTAFSYDSKGNMTSDGARSYAFSSENLLAGITIGSSTASLGYDPAMRLYQGVEGGNATRFLFEGGDLIAEYANSSLINRYVPGPGTDEPMGSTNASGSRSWTYADERGSIIATEGSTIRINTYDEYGKPGGTPTGRFGYTGLPRLNPQLHYARARFYDSNTGRFVQPDPIGYGDGMNMYGYVGGDPVNFGDPTGTDMENALYSNRAHPIDNDDEWYLGKGVNLIALAGGHSRDGMGMWDNVFSVSGRVDVLSYERAVADLPEATRKLNRYSTYMGVSAGCLLKAGCTASAVSSLSKNASSLGNLSKDLLVSGRAHSLKLMAVKGDGKHEWTMQPLASRDFIWYELRTAFGGEVTKPEPGVWILNVTPNSRVVYRSSTRGGGRTLEFRNPYLNNRGYLKFRFSY